mgnify:FL=1
MFDSLGVNLIRIVQNVAALALLVVSANPPAAAAEQGGNDFFVGKPPHQMYVQ